MWTHKKSVTLSLVLTYLFMVLLAAGIIALPWLVTWYVEIRGRDAALPTTIMLTCYPCVPFAALALWSMRCLLHNIRDGKPFLEKNIKMLHRISWCCFAVMAIMLYSGRFYLPFYVSAIAAAFIGLIIRVIKNLYVVSFPLETEEEKEKTTVEKARSVRDK